jgi:hypothetical protein
MKRHHWEGVSHAFSPPHWIGPQLWLFRQWNLGAQHTVGAQSQGGDDMRSQVRCAAGHRVALDVATAFTAGLGRGGDLVGWSSL